MSSSVPPAFKVGEHRRFMSNKTVGVFRGRADPYDGLECVVCCVLRFDRWAEFYLVRFLEGTLLEASVEELLPL